MISLEEVPLLVNCFNVLDLGVSADCIPPTRAIFCRHFLIGVPESTFSLFPDHNSSLS